MESRFGSRRKPSTIKPILGVAIGSFALGASLVGYFAWKNGAFEAESEAPQLAVSAPETSEAEAAEPSAAASAASGDGADASAAVEQAASAEKAVELVAEQQGGLDQRLAAAEQRLTRLDLQAQAAASNAARAEGLLIAFAARRAIERGAELGYLADQLRLRFGDALPNAVRTVIAFSRDPVTLDQLLARLEGLAPELKQADETPSWESFKRQLAALFVIRRESTPSPAPEKRIERARLFLESGRVDAAIAEVQNLPGAAKAANWIADAKRYGEAMRALDLIETAAVLEPRKLRDGAGNPIGQTPAKAGQ